MFAKKYLGHATIVVLVLASIGSNLHTEAQMRKYVQGDMPYVLPGGASITGDQMEVGNQNGHNSAVFGILVSPTKTMAFPTALTSFTIMSSPGDQAFAHYSASYGTTDGLWTTEIDSFNYLRDSPSYFPWPRGLGMKESVGVAITCAMDGPNLSAACMEIGHNPQKNNGGQYGIAVRAGATKQAALIVEATADNGGRSDLILRHKGKADGATIEMATMGKGDAPVIRHRDSTGRTTYELNPDGSITGPVTTRQHFHAPLQSPSEQICAAGDFLYDKTAVYVCVGPNHWRHTLLSD